MVWGGKTNKTKSAQVKILSRDQALKIPSPVPRKPAVDRAMADRSGDDAVGLLPAKDVGRASRTYTCFDW